MKSLQVHKWLPEAQEKKSFPWWCHFPLSEWTAIQPNVVSQARIQVICHWPVMLMKPRCSTPLVPPGPAPLSCVVPAIWYPESRCLFWLSWWSGTVAEVKEKLEMMGRTETDKHIHTQCVYVWRHCHVRASTHTLPHRLVGRRSVTVPVQLDFITSLTN